jgi:16S rRNA C967 or C1407 C5-methylase (RsmB/RsmF family)
MIDHVGNRKHSAHFTDVEVAENALRLAVSQCPDLAVALSGHVRFLDPCCGSGALTEAAINVMRDCGATSLDLVAVELQPEYLQQYQDRLRGIVKRPKTPPTPVG